MVVADLFKRFGFYYTRIEVVVGGTLRRVLRRQKGEQWRVVE
jgi:hypothetical protein